MLPRWIVSGLILGIGWKDSDDVSPIIYLLILAYVIGLWYLITWAWEKINYIGSFEWIISRINLGFAKIGRKMKDGKRLATMGSSKRNMGDLVHNVDWIDLSHLYERTEVEKREKRFLLTSSILGIFCFPFIISSVLMFNKNVLKKPTSIARRFYIYILVIILYSIIQFLSISIYLLTLTGLSI